MLSVIAGLILIEKPFETLVVFALILGVWFVVAGVVRIVSAFASSEGRGAGLLIALLDLIAGVVILAWPDLGLSTLAVIVGIGLAVRGALFIAAGWQLRALDRARGCRAARSRNGGSRRGRSRGAGGAARVGPAGGDGSAGPAACASAAPASAIATTPTSSDSRAAAAAAREDRRRRSRLGSSGRRARRRCSTAIHAGVAATSTPASCAATACACCSPASRSGVRALASPAAAAGRTTSGSDAHAVCRAASRTRRSSDSAALGPAGITNSRPSPSCRPAGGSPDHRSGATPPRPAAPPHGLADRGVRERLGRHPQRRRLDMQDEHALRGASFPSVTVSVNGKLPVRSTRPPMRARGVQREPRRQRRLPDIRRHTAHRRRLRPVRPARPRDGERARRDRQPLRSARGAAPRRVAEQLVGEVDRLHALLVGRLPGLEVALDQQVPQRPEIPPVRRGDAQHLVRVHQSAGLACGARDASPCIGKWVKRGSIPNSSRMRARTPSSRAVSTPVTVPQASQTRYSRSPSPTSP